MKSFFITLITLCLLIMVSTQSHASLIRDSEIERSIRSLSDPLLIAAGLTPDSVDIYILNNSEINAFVTGGQNIFIHTGLIGLSQNPSMLTGVIAHEIGHISGGHLLKGRDNITKTTINTAVGYVLGLAAAAAGAPEAGMAIALGGEHVAKRQYLKHTRTNEEAADQAAIVYLEEVGASAQGLSDLFDILYSKQHTLYGQVNPYSITHPLAKERVRFVENHLEHAKKEERFLTKAKKERFARSVVKLNAFLKPYRETLREFPETNQSMLAKYARAIAYYKIPNLKKSLKEINALIKQSPKDPYFHELKGQILFENGRITESVSSYEKAYKYAAREPLIQIGLATSLIATNNASKYNRAINLLRQSVAIESNNSFAWRQLAIAYGRKDLLGFSNLALAEEAVILQEYDNAVRFVQIASKHIKTGSPADLRMQDLKQIIKKNKKKQKKK